ncbi:hypothetical protein [Portibacter lacus]|uniref:Uncharacterized protein n=1 Tax=Portibacter lacus TaxID=1099794 RepID=A0AA37WDN4_9BACT|nr:hypothetical protein [Portibacter lacus]GLR18101.1 hypothetical protein GCM10007940_27160 [Portibacter lacus]
MEARMMKLETVPNNVLNVDKKDTALFQKVQLKNNFQVYNFNEEELISKLELLILKFDEIFRV